MRRSPNPYPIGLREPSFAPGHSVVAGPSNTSKSLIGAAINFVFGSSDPMGDVSRSRRLRRSLRSSTHGRRASHHVSNEHGAAVISDNTISRPAPSLRPHRTSHSAQSTPLINQRTSAQSFSHLLVSQESSYERSKLETFATSASARTDTRCWCAGAGVSRCANPERRHRIVSATTSFSQPVASGYWSQSGTNS
jgi:hypothetical protein